MELFDERKAVICTVTKGKKISHFQKFHKGKILWEQEAAIFPPMYESGSGEKSPSKDMEKFFSNFQICHNQFLYLKTQPTGVWKLWCQFLRNWFLDIFAVCSLVRKINLPHTQQSYLCPKNINYLLEKADLRFFLSYGLMTTIKITIFSSFYVKDNFQAKII